MTKNQSVPDPDNKSQMMPRPASLVYTRLYFHLVSRAIRLRAKIERPLLGALRRGSRYCPRCDSRYLMWLKSGYPSPQNQRLRIIGARVHRHACPGCGLADRERLIAFWLMCKRSDYYHHGFRILHIAPEKYLSSIIRQQEDIEYIAGDKQPTHYSERLQFEVHETDITKLEFPSDHFDLIICNHVLEHVIEDMQAMQELRRVLKPSGEAILQIPYTTRLTRSIENPAVASGKEKWLQMQWFGMPTHVRVYARDDYLERLRTAGFIVKPRPISDWTDNPLYLSSINSEEELFICSKEPE